MLLAKGWKDYELIDVGEGKKLERWGEHILSRPEPQAIWPIIADKKQWDNADAYYNKAGGGGGAWTYNKQIPKKWTIKYRNLSFFVEPVGFKHTGIFPEQAVNWDWIIDNINSAGRPIRLLNLFAYTGAATVAAASAGADVCHVDAAKGIVSKAKNNLELSGLSSKPVRFIVDDVVKFVKREKRRGRTYDAIIMDPPSYGRGPKGELWKIENEIFNLISHCVEVLSPKPLFFLVNSYTTALSPIVIGNMITMLIKSKFGGSITADELGIESSSGLILPCGSSVRWKS
jgi:23S rRNA (cytosine1962-C5)-methyltransferase